MLCRVDSHTDGTFKLKFVTIIVGIVDVILAAVGSCGDRNDIYFLVTVLVVFAFSFLHFMCSLLDVFKSNCTSRAMEFLFHLIGGVLIMITAIVILSGTSATSCHVMEKTSAATVGICNSLIYLYICWLIFQLLRRRNDSSSLPLFIFCGLSRVPVFPPMEDDPDLRRKLSSEIPIKLSKSRISTQESILMKSNPKTPMPPTSKFNLMAAAKERIPTPLNRKIQSCVALLL